MARVMRKAAIRISSAYRTVSTAAVMVVAGVIPTHLLADERCKIHEGRREGEDVHRRRTIREETLMRWQEEWSSERKGAWTRTLIPDVRRWYKRTHGEVNHYITQLLTGHGCFQTYLYSIGKVETEECYYCGEIDTPEHTLFHCSRWTAERRKVDTEMRETLGPASLMNEMLTSREGSRRVAALMNLIMEQKIRDEWDALRGLNP